MTQRALVVKTNEKYATVEIDRKSACEGCSASGGCAECSRPFRAVAINECGAKVGDAVEIESASSKILGFAALVFVLPIALGLILYFFVMHFSGSEAAAYASALGGFVAVFVFLYFFSRKSKAAKNNVSVVRIINDDAADGD